MLATSVCSLTLAQPEAPAYGAAPPVSTTGWLIAVRVAAAALAPLGKVALTCGTVDRFIVAWSTSARL